jgi:hypothetical protein
MNMNRKSVVHIVYGTALIAACSGKLAVDDARNANNSSGGNAGAGGAGGLDGSILETGGTANQTGGAGGVAGADTGGVAGWAVNGGAAGTVPWETGGAAGCFSGPEPTPTGTGGQGAGGIGGINPTCPLDGQGFAAVSLADMCNNGNGVDGGPVANGGPYRCAAASSELIEGLDCSEVTTSHGGFTKTVGCGFETIEFQSYDYRGPYDLEHRYAASYNVSTGKLVGLVIKEPNQFGPCMSYAYRAGSVPADCASAVTYKCKRIAQTGATQAPYEGCRSPTDPGCAQCCEPYNDLGSTVYSAQNGATTYNWGSGHDHKCDCGLGICAKCKLEDERSVRVMVRHPECNCSLPPAGEPCASWCNSKRYWDGVCPGLL